MRIILTIADVRDQLNQALDLALEKDFVKSNHCLHESQKIMNLAIEMSESIVAHNQLNEKLSLDFLKTISEMITASQKDVESMAKLLPVLEEKFLSPIK
ncbi:PTS lactose/cellobiose transporter subunit IIA [Vagococcus zengguangii]|nr:PTS lactose/cellobiose transporter subunit IIA [Vagococcus zengguangii]